MCVGWGEVGKFTHNPQTSQIPGRSKHFYGKISDVRNTKIFITFDSGKVLTYFFGKFSKIYLVSQAQTRSKPGPSPVLSYKWP